MRHMHVFMLAWGCFDKPSQCRNVARLSFCWLSHYNKPYQPLFSLPDIYQGWKKPNPCKYRRILKLGRNYFHVPGCISISCQFQRRQIVITFRKNLQQTAVAISSSDTPGKGILPVHIFELLFWSLASPKILDLCVTQNWYEGCEEDVRGGTCSSW